jgi:uncharacterized protein (DUF2267 family)/mannose-6-phosphate isomerase-like protein (cupin superfamily)
MPPHEPMTPAGAHHDTTIVKVDSTRSPRGDGGEKYLASGVRVAMRLWDDEPVGETHATERDYETVGYVISGLAELHIERQVVRLEAGDSYMVPRGARHHYRILAPFTAVEATSPPAHARGRDERTRSSRHLDRDARDRFVHRVAAHAMLPRDVSAVAASTAVMCALAERLTAGEAHGLLEALPRSLRPFFERGVLHRGGSGKLDRAELLDRVANDLGVTPAHAERVCAVVFDAVRHELPSKLIDDVAHQLPRDLQALWLARRGGARAARALTEDDARGILDRIGRCVELPAGTTADGAFAAVMGALCARLSGGQARDVLLGLPTGVRPLLEPRVALREESAPVFGRDELLERIAAELDTSVAAAEPIARVVFAAVRRVLPEKEVGDVASQLPAELVELWQSH